MLLDALASTGWYCELIARISHGRESWHAPKAVAAGDTSANCRAATCRRRTRTRLASAQRPDHLHQLKAGKVRAEGWLADERALIEADTWTRPADRRAARTVRAITLHDYAEKWIKDRPVKARTRLLYESQLKLHIKPTIGTREITTVTPEAVRSWYAALGTEHTRRNSQVYGLLHGIMATAVKDGLVTINPCQIERAMNVQREA